MLQTDNLLFEDQRLLLFSHLGLTAGVTIILEKVLQKHVVYSQLGVGRSQRPAVKLPKGVKPDPQFNSSTDSLQHSKIDYRLVLVASLLPDIIDKPLGLIILPVTLGSSRNLGHTILFLLVLFLLGLFFLKKRADFRLLLVAYCSTIHLALDRMWERPQVLFWPFLGYKFSHSDPTEWINRVTTNALAHPDVYIPEIVGIVICILFAVHLLKNKAVIKFIRNGIFP